MTFRGFYEEFSEEVKKIIKDINKLLDMVEMTTELHLIEKIHIKDYLKSAIGKLYDAIDELETYKILRGEEDL